MFDEVDFSQLQPSASPVEQAENMDALIELLGTNAIEEDLSHIKGEDIVSGNHQHVANLLQILYQLSLLIVEKRDEEEKFMDENEIKPRAGLNDDDDDDAEDEGDEQY